MKNSIVHQSPNLTIRLLWLSIKTGFWSAVAIISAHTILMIQQSLVSNALALSNSIENKFQKVIYVPVSPSEPILSVVTANAARHWGIPRIALQGIVGHESQGKHSHLRLEAHLLKNFKREPWMINEAEYQMMATSIGYGQVIYGWHKQTCGLTSYTELFDIETNIDCAAHVLRVCLDKFKSVTNNDTRYRLAYGCYNGDTSGAYAQKIMNQIARIAVGDK